MDKIEMDWNLKTLASFSSSSSVFVKIAKKKKPDLDYSLFFAGEITYI